MSESVLYAGLCIFKVGANIGEMGRDENL